MSVSIFALMALGFCFVTGLDPYLDLFVLGSVPVAVSVPAMECMTAAAIVAFFLKDRRGESLWTVRIAPILATVALAVVVCLVLSNLPFYTGQEGAINWILPGINLVALIVGMARARWMRRTQPERYLEIGRYGLD